MSLYNHNVRYRNHIPNMLRTAIYFMIVLCMPSFNMAQESFEWEKVEVPLTLSISILSQTQEGYLIGQRSAPDQLIISKDGGQTWDLFYEGPLFYCEKNPIVWDKVKELERGVYYMRHTHSILKYNPGTKDFDPFIALNAAVHGVLFDYQLLDDQNISVVTKNSILLYNLDGELLKEKSDSLKAVWKNIAVGTGSFYVHRNRSPLMYQYQNDLEVIQEEVPIQEAYIGGIEVVGNKLMTAYHQSKDQGKTWTRLSFPNKQDVLYFNQDHHGHLIFAGHQGVSISRDSGQTFISLPSPVEGFRPEFCGSLDDGRIIASSVHPTSSEVFIYDFDGDAWHEADNSSRIPFANKVIAGMNGNTFISNGTNISHFKNNVSSEWSLIYQRSSDSLSFKPDEMMKDMFTFDEGLCFGYNHSKAFISEDQGLNWIQEKKFSRPKYLIETDQRTFYFSLSGDVFVYAGDLKHMEKINTANGVLARHRIHGVTKSEKAMVSNPQYIGQFFFYDLKTNEKTKIPFPRPIYGQLLISGFHDQEGFLLVKQRQNSGMEITVHREDGQIIDSYFHDLKFESKFKVLSLYNQHLVAYDTRQIFLSQDKGKTWREITPDQYRGSMITYVTTSPDGFLYFSSMGDDVYRSVRSFRK